MQIKQQMLAQQIQKKIAPLYVLIGQDNYLLEDSLSTIKTAIKKSHDYDEKTLSLQTAEDWNTLRDEANSYSLFSDTQFLNCYLDKKTVDAAGKKILTEYLNSINTRCFIVIRAPNVPAKQLQWLTTNEHAVVCVSYPLNAVAMKQWIITQLKHNLINYEAQVPEVIHQYTQGNMLACAQVIEKIALAYQPNTTINVLQAKEHLSNQCDHNLFELIDACLLGQGDQVIQILRHAANNKTEATLVLWMLAQEIRALMQLDSLLQQKIDIRNAAAQLKIWPQRTNLYQSYCNRMNQTNKAAVGLPSSQTTTFLLHLHRYCSSIDEAIKSNVNRPIWSSLENLALSLSLGTLMGDVCTA